MTIKDFRRLPQQEQCKVVRKIDDPIAAQILETAFLGGSVKSWAAVAIATGYTLPDTVRMIATRALAKIER